MSDTSPPKVNAAVLWKVLLAGYWLAMLVGTHLPPVLTKQPHDQRDKLFHFAGYAGLAWLLAMAWQSSSGRLNGRHLRLLWVAIAVVAIIDEVTQPLTQRDANVFDWLADVSGAAVGLLVFLLARRMLERK